MGPSFVETLPVRKFHGIGPATARKMAQLGIETGLDLKGQPLEFLQHHFGEAGSYYYWAARGVDERPVRADPEFAAFLGQACHNLAASSTAGSLHYICMDWRHLDVVLAVGREAYGELKNVCVWVKDNAGMGSFYRSQNELVLVFKQRGGPHRNNVQLGQFGRNRSNVWHYPGANSFARGGGEGNLLALHPTVGGRRGFGI
jgi:hypothetical protein